VRKRKPWETLGAKTGKAGRMESSQVMWLSSVTEGVEEVKVMEV
jgi:hypothetical protein